MALDQSENFVRETTSESVDSSQTSIGVSNASAFPDPTNGEYNAVLWDSDNHPRPDQDSDVEVVRITGRDTGTDTLTVTRGQESTSAVSHPSGSAIQVAPTAKMFSDIQTKTSGLSDDGKSLSIQDQTIVDTSTDPSTSGEIRQNSNDVRVYSGGAVRDLSAIGNEGQAVGEVGWDYPVRRWEVARYYDIGPTTAAGTLTKPSSNPVFTPSSSGWDSSIVTDPGVIRVEDTYYMFYRGENSSEEIGLAYSTDLENWTRHDDNPILTTGPNSWDQNALNDPCPFAVGDTYYLFYQGTDDGSSNSIGFATSTDLVNWTKSSDNPVLTPGASGSWNDSGIGQPSILRVGNTYHMIHHGYDGSTHAIGHQTSTDLVNWTADSNNPVLTAGSGWESSEVLNSALTRGNTTYHLLYRGYDGSTYQIGHATSEDLSNWTRDNENPILSPGSGFDSNTVGQPTVLRIENTYHILYHAYDGSTHTIGLANIDISPPTRPPIISNFTAQEI